MLVSMHVHVFVCTTIHVWKVRKKLVEADSLFLHGSEGLNSGLVQIDFTH